MEWDWMFLKFLSQLGNSCPLASFLVSVWSRPFSQKSCFVRQKGHLHFVMNCSLSSVCTCVQDDAISFFMSMKAALKVSYYWEALKLMQKIVSKRRDAAMEEPKSRRSLFAKNRSLFRPSATSCRIGLMESRLHHRCHCCCCCCGCGTPPPTPL